MSEESLSQEGRVAVRANRAYLLSLVLTQLLFFIAALAVFWLFPYNLALFARVFIAIVLVLSVDLVLGYAGIITMGQAAMYGTGAYAAGLFAIHVSGDPLIGLAVGAGAGALIAFLSGLLMMRMSGLKLMIMTIAVAQICQEVANKMRDVTGGADGLTGIAINALPGGLSFDLLGQTAYWYSWAVAAIVLVFLQVLTASPLGLSARGILESSDRMRAIGSPVYWRLVTIYTIGGAIAGLAGALSAQILAFVSLESYGFVVSAEAVLMLILGGAGRLYGALLGTVAYMSIHHIASAINPYHWLFVIGGLVLVVVMFLPNGLIDLPNLLMRIRGKLR